jgi:hypothetical protein
VFKAKGKQDNCETPPYNLMEMSKNSSKVSSAHSRNYKPEAAALRSKPVTDDYSLDPHTIISLETKQDDTESVSLDDIDENEDQIFI